MRMSTEMLTRSNTRWPGWLAKSSVPKQEVGDVRLVRFWEPEGKDFGHEHNTKHLHLCISVLYSITSVPLRMTAQSTKMSQPFDHSESMMPSFRAHLL
jgi:hypothetical protein